jgi:hypothetical protein
MLELLLTLQLPTSSKLCACRPGAYQTTPKWASSHAKAPLQREAASKKVSELLATATAAVAAVAVAAVQSAGKASSRVADVPVLTPPSIPARHQSYGYEALPAAAGHDCVHRLRLLLAVIPLAS